MEETQSKVAHTGLAILVYLSYGIEPKDKTPHGMALAKGLKWLIEQVPANGNMRDGGRMYGQAIGTLALGEAFGITGDEKLRLPLRRATLFLIEAQNPRTGGWRYQPHPSLTHAGDLSVTGWVIMKLRSAEMGGMLMPNKTMDWSRRFLEMVAAGPAKGKYGYKDARPNYCMTSVGMWCPFRRKAGPRAPAGVRPFSKAAFTRPRAKEFLLLVLRFPVRLPARRRALGKVERKNGAHLP